MQIESKTDAGASIQGSRDVEGVAERVGVTASQTWDPYEVWLQRVRRPRAGSGAIASLDRVRQRTQGRS